MTTLTLHLLGKPQIIQDGKPLAGFISAKAQALLIYLAATGRPHSREALAGLLWADMPEAQAAKNLRNALSNLKGLAGPYLNIARDEVSFNRESDYWLDVDVFLAALSDLAETKELRTLHNAVELYQGDFLEGFYVDDALALDEWMAGRRSLLKGLMLQALHTLVVRHLERAEHAAGIDYANRLLVLEPWREETHRHLMILLARSRQRSAALAQYESCRKVLAAELGVEPMPETSALYNRLKAAAAPPPHNLPPQPTPFVGREPELAEIAAFLDNPNAQLLTLVGPGGIGKTRLALQAAAQCIDPEMAIEAHFVDGVFLIPLAADTLLGPDQPSESLIEALAAGLRIDLSGPIHPQAQLLNSLRDKELLLLLDNFEYMSNQARQLADILRLAPKLKALVTSRVRLNLQQEGLIEVKGLDVPSPAEAAEPAQEYSAVKLFLQQARRVQSGFALAEGEWGSVIRICQLVEGAPLGIELAASWLRVLSCAEIVVEIEKGLDFLTTNWQNVPERHRSLRAVFDYSWNLLSPVEQAAFAKLAVFHGGFQREAAAGVADAALPLLAEMVDKSLLRRAATGRFELHDLLRHYAEEKLKLDEELYTQVHNAHCRYYAEFMAAHRAELIGEDVSDPLTELNAERENVRAAWNWAVSQRRVEELNILMDCL